MSSLAASFDGKSTKSKVRPSAFQKLPNCLSAARLWVLNLHEMENQAFLKSRSPTKRARAGRAERSSYL